MRRLLFLPIVALALAGMSVFTVDRAEYVYVTRLGRHRATFDGATQAGLHLRWPWPIESAQHLDRRLEVLDLPPTEQLTLDAGGQTVDRTLTVEGFVCWRIAGADAVDRFVRTVGSLERARGLLAQQVSSRLSAEIGKMEIAEFLSEHPGHAGEGVGRLRARMLAPFCSQARAPDEDGPAAYGIEVVDVRLRRFNYPAEVRPAIWQRIVSEREKKKAEYEGEATLRVGQISADAERQARQLAAEGQARARQLRGEAEAETDRIRNDAFSKDSEFYVFLKKLEEYESILGNRRTVLLLSSHRELFDLLFAPPHPGATGVPPHAAAGPRPAATPVTGRP